MAEIVSYLTLHFYRFLLNRYVAFSYAHEFFSFVVLNFAEAIFSNQKAS